jgi:UDP-N-acetyl-D-mannosaminuronic acid dehydrogenase
VIGLGYVGFPVACEFARVGFDTLGVELQSGRIEIINAGRSPIQGMEPGLNELAAQVIATGKLHTTHDYNLLTDRDVILICVETPVDEKHHPNYKALRSSITGLGPYLQYGALIIVESTTAPGTIRDIVLPYVEECSGKTLNEGFYLGNCPERVMPGKLLANIRNVSRVAGGMTPDTAETIRLLYHFIVHSQIDITDCTIAELVKTVENAYRDVQIAFANEVAMICEKVGGDVWRVRELVNKSPGRMMLLPGAGVGGHCIPKDPWLLAYSVHRDPVPIRIIPAAREVNDNMPGHLAGLIQFGLNRHNIDIAGARILVLGFAYLENSDDSRNSPSEALVKHLCGLGAEVVIHDPYIRRFDGSLLDKARDCDLAVVMVMHKQYQEMDLKSLIEVMRNPILVDGRAVFGRERAEQAGFDYLGIGIPLPKP